MIYQAKFSHSLTTTKVSQKEMLTSFTKNNKVNYLGITRKIYNYRLIKLKAFFRMIYRIKFILPR